MQKCAEKQCRFEQLKCAVDSQVGCILSPNATLWLKDIILEIGGLKKWDFAVENGRF